MDINIEPITTFNLPGDTMLKFQDWRKRIDGVMDRDRQKLMEIRDQNHLDPHPTIS